MSRGIDYSKWDKMDFSDGEDDQSGSEFHDQNTPRVTRLDEPSSVTFGNPNGSDINITKSINTARPQNTQTIQKLIKNDVQETSSDNENGTEFEQDTKYDLLTRNGGTFIDPSANTETFWSQDRLEVGFSVAFDGTQIASRDIQVEVKGALNYKDRFAAVGGNKPIDTDNASSKGELIVRASSTVLFKGHLAYSIYLPENEEEVDWEIDATDPNKKLVKITLLKALPMQGLTIWWSKPFLSYPEIDVVNDIQDRDKKKTSKSAKNHEQMKAVWDEAHRMFKEKVKNREKQSIDIS